MQLEHGTWELRLGDCLDAETGLASLESADHIITDPPYEAEAHTKGRRIKTSGGGGVYGSTGSAPLEFESITPAIRSAAAHFFGRVARRWVLIFCQVEAVGEWKAEIEIAGLIYKRACAFVKRDAQPQLSGDRPGMGYESIICAHTPGRSRWNGGGKRGVYTSVRATTERGKGKAFHQTEKPMALMLDLVRDFTDPDELICDPFAGSGTTGIACLQLGRRFIGWEKDPKYHAIACKRLAQTREQLGLFKGERIKPKQSKLDL